MLWFGLARVRSCLLWPGLVGSLQVSSLLVLSAVVWDVISFAAWPGLACSNVSDPSDPTHCPSIWERRKERTGRKKGKQSWEEWREERIGRKEGGGKKG